MAYKKPEIVAKSEAKQSFVAGCSASRPPESGCFTVRCEMRRSR